MSSHVSKGRRSAMKDATVDHSADDGNSRGDVLRRSRRKQEFERLHQEMELVEHGVAKSGHARRVVSRRQSKVRTMKRKLLERQEADDEKGNDDADNIVRPRGALAAVDDSVIQRSLIYGGAKKHSSTLRNGEIRDEGDQIDDESLGEGAPHDEESEEDTGLNLVEDENSEESSDEDIPVVDVEAAVSTRGGKSTASQSKKAAKRPSTGTSNPARKTRRPLQKRLRNFRSRKMAERHGAALGAHVSGKPGLAIRKLKQVAASAPAAPQVYSSLGMVYEDMLVESQRKHSIGRVALEKDTPSADTEAQDVILCEQLSLAKKAYGSYHVAAIFCKRDYSLWLRAADSAFEIAGLHTTTMLLPGMTNDAIEYHRGEKLRWLEEAKHDYHMADNLNPPGIDIPAKLASTLIELGHLSEALTLLTDLKNRDEFDSSYRAWVLYADLMLRIGHECTQWNQGIQTNGNHMFRRWLRKFSSKFDWRERRLQALAKALEAACGSRSCQRLIHWLKQRVETSDAFDMHDDTNETCDEEVATEANLPPTERGRALRSTAKEEDCLEKEKQLLLQANRVELAGFDKVTESLSLALGSPDAEKRDSERLALIAKHKTTLVELVGGFHTKHRTMAASNSKTSIEGNNSERCLPLSASCNTTFSIASELLRHLLSMQLFDGGSLAGESVSSYLKERAASSDHRLMVREQFDQSQQRPVDIFAMHHETYDEQDKISDEDEGAMAPLSDDEGFDSVNSHAVLRVLRSGTLPPELQFLYGLCLAGEGGKAYLAIACTKALNEIPIDPVSWITEPVVDAGVVADASWLHFRVERTQGLRRVAALSLAVDVFNSGRCDRWLTAQVAPLLRKSVDELSKIQLLDKVLLMNGQVDSACEYRRNLLVKVLVAETRLGVDQIESPDAMSAASQSMLTHAVDLLSKVVPVVWSVDKGSITSTCCETVVTIARTFSLISLRREGSSMVDDNLLISLFRLVSILCNSAALTVGDNIPRSSSDITVLPFSSSWLSPDLASLSLRSFNLCVATNVSLFSGWEPEQFSLRLMRGTTFNFFGITTEDSIMAGHITESHEEELGQQWDLLRSILPAAQFDFKEKLQQLKESPWYKTSRERYKATETRHCIFTYEEDSALSALLSFSRICLRHAMESDEKSLFVALSILLPVSQFCLNEAIWDSYIGRQESGGSTKLWQDFSVSDKANAAPSCRPGYVRPCKRALVVAVENDSERALHEWFSWEDDSDPTSNIVAIPLYYLHQTWRQFACLDFIDEMPPPTYLDVMKEVDECIAKLRSSYTIPTVEKASLQVSASLIRLASHPKCCNPFVCLQEAVMFASMSSKGGTCDSVFQARLPPPGACRPIDALLIIGRAECLNALHFCQEAAFLCCYLATTCSMHRKEDPSFHKDLRWMIIASLTYDLSVVIRNLAGTLLREHDKREDTSGTWDVAVMSELHQARTISLEWKTQAAIRTFDVVNQPIPAVAAEGREIHPPPTVNLDLFDEVENQRYSTLIERHCVEGMEYEELNAVGFVEV